MKYIPYGRQYIDQDDIDSVVRVLQSDWLTQGPKINEFEESVAAYHGCKHAVAFCNGTAALHGAYYVSTKFPFGAKGNVIGGIDLLNSWNKPCTNEGEAFKKQYWEFITSPITFVASANGGIYCNGSPRFADIDINSFCIDIEKIEELITEDTRVITPVSYAGYPVDLKAIKNLSKVRENNICIIHDACHAIGARRDGHGIADYADMTILSFHPVKHITTGEGGMVLTNNEEYYQKLILFRNHGITKEEGQFLKEKEGDWYYEMQELGYNYRITDIQCALGLSQLKKLDKFLYNRNRIAQNYEYELGDINWMRMAPGFDKSWIFDGLYNNLDLKPDNMHSYHLFPILLDKKIDRKKFFNYMRQNGIGVQVHYIPVNRQAFYDCNFSPIADDFYAGQLSLPMYYNYSEEDFNIVIKCIRAYNKIY